jgi:hypothetical protein
MGRVSDTGPQRCADQGDERRKGRKKTYLPPVKAQFPVIKHEIREKGCDGSKIKKVKRKWPDFSHAIP